MDYIESNIPTLLEEAPSLQAFIEHPKLYYPKAEFVNGLTLIDVSCNNIISIIRLMVHSFNF